VLPLQGRQLRPAQRACLKTAPPLRVVAGDEAAAIRKALVVFVHKKLDSTKGLRFFAIRLEGQDIVVVQRAFDDIAPPSASGRFALIFAISTLEQGKFHALQWKKNAIEEDERVLATFRLKSGRDFLVTTVSDPESQSFRVYGIRDGQLAVVYSGGGSSC
jgi:hypothetical protein